MTELLRKSGAEGEASTLGRSDAAKMAIKARAMTDNYFLATAVLGYKDLTPRTHGPICRFLEQVRVPRRMILHPRTTFKTTIAIVVDCIRLILNDPDVRILVIMDADMNASLTLQEMQGHFERNDMFRWLFAELVPDFGKVRWNNNELEVAGRKQYRKEATVTAIGSTGAAESKHFDVIKADDIIAEKHIHSDVEMDKACKLVTGLEPLLVHENCQIDFIGSRKKRGDVYTRVEEYYFGDGRVTPLGPYAELRGDLAVFSRSLEEGGESIFPERFSKHYIARMKEKDPERYWSQLANNPRASGLNTFREEDLRFFKVEGGEKEGELNIVWTEGEEEKKLDIWGMERILLYDPSVAEKSMSSKAALIVTAKGEGPRRYVLESLIAHIQPDESVQELFRMYREWLPSTVSIERRGFQGSIKYWLEERAELLGEDSLPVVEWPPEGSPKAQWAKTEHIRGLQPLVRNHLIWLNEGQEELVAEFATWPHTRWDDGLDALAQGLEYWPYQEARTEREARMNAEQRYLARVMRGTSGMQPMRVPVVEDDWSEERFLEMLNSGGYGFKFRVSGN